MTDAASLPVYRLDDGVAVVTMDDGKANAVSPAVLDTLGDALDRAAADGARAFVLAGRPGKFSAGFDLATMTSGVEPMRALVEAGARFMMRLYGLGIPTVAACTGHALAGGALLLLSCDHRVGGTNPAKIGLNEVAIGMGLPIFAVELARDRLAPAEFQPATMQARLYDPAGAVTAGYLDRTVADDEVVTEAIADARRLAELRTGAYAGTKAHVRRRTIDHINETLSADMAGLTGPT
jgi:enoyl-CoA hydratase